MDRVDEWGRVHWTPPGKLTPNGTRNSNFKPMPIQQYWNEKVNGKWLKKAGYLYDGKRITINQELVEQDAKELTDKNSSTCVITFDWSHDETLAHLGTTKL